MFLDNGNGSIWTCDSENFSKTSSMYTHFICIKCTFNGLFKQENQRPCHCTVSAVSYSHVLNLLGLNSTHYSPLLDYCQVD